MLPFHLWINRSFESNLARSKSWKPVTLKVADMHGLAVILTILDLMISVEFEYEILVIMEWGADEYFMLYLSQLERMALRVLLSSLIWSVINLVDLEAWPLFWKGGHKT